MQDGELSIISLPEGPQLHFKIPKKAIYCWFVQQSMPSGITLCNWERKNFVSFLHLENFLLD